MDIHAESKTPFERAAFAAFFLNPSAGYRGTPFWSWNGTLERDRLLAQAARFDEMGMGGAHVHVRTGMRTPYLSEEYLDHVKAVAESQAARGKLLWLYDEDRWPSGSAGGTVTRKNPEFRRTALVLTTTPNEAFLPPTTPIRHIDARRNGTGVLIARWALTLDGPRLRSCRRLADGKAAIDGETVWYGYVEKSEDGTWFNNSAYIDAMNPRAMEAFADATYGAYARAIGLGAARTDVCAADTTSSGGPCPADCIPAIFTDEPQLLPIKPLPPSDGAAAGSFGSDILLSWTDDFAATYAERFSTDPLDALPEVVWDLADGSVSPARWRYHEHRSALFAAAFAGTLGRRCRELGVQLSGHLMEEDSLEGQTAWTGETMRSYVDFGIPGIDLLCDAFLPGTAKQATSVVRQLGGTAALSELYGVTGWHFDFTGHKRQGDWQAAAGITVRVPHLSWMDMAGEAKRDYPAAIDWHSPWWREYRLVEDHFARVAAALTRGKARTRVAVLHPVESAWLLFGPRDGSGAGLSALDERFAALVKALTESLIDFDFVAESLLPTLGRVRTDARFGVGEAVYDVVVIPYFSTIRSTTLSALADFAARGGRILALGNSPRFVDGSRDDAVAAKVASVSSRAGKDQARFNSAPRNVPADMAALISSLEEVREIRAIRADGSAATALSAQYREDGDGRWLFICDSRRGAGAEHLALSVRGDWTAERWDTLSGSVEPVAVVVEDGWSSWKWTAYPAGHELVRLVPRVHADIESGLADAGRQGFERGAIPRTIHEATLIGPFRFTRNEPNVLVLDRASYRVAESPAAARGDGSWSAPLEVLRLDNAVRARFGLPPVDGDIAQPWSEPPAPVLGRVELRFRITCAVAVGAPRLAVEQAASTRISVDGRAIASTPDGFWVDESIATVPLPALSAGEHELVVSQEVRRDTTREWCYLLGDFAVGLDPARTEATLVAESAELAPADLVPQGYPFYAGCIELECPIELRTGGRRLLELGPYDAPLASVSVDGGPWITAAFPPYITDLGELSAGKHVVRVKLFGNRANAFGPLHLSPEKDFKWLGPSSYRTDGVFWSESWQLKSFGLSAPPRLLRAR